MSLANIVQSANPALVCSVAECARPIYNRMRITAWKTKRATGAMLQSGDCT